MKVWSTFVAAVTSLPVSLLFSATSSSRVNRENTAPRVQSKSLCALTIEPILASEVICHAQSSFDREGPFGRAAERVAREGCRYGRVRFEILTITCP